MSTLRKRLSAWSIAWLLCQVASLSAFLPPDCCTAHQAAAETSENCHKTAAAEKCPMHAANGETCPMHQAGSPEKDARECAMRGTCDGPAVALASLFWIPGILLDETSARVDFSTSLLTLVADRTPDAPASLDTPPPKS